MESNNTPTQSFARRRGLELAAFLVLVALLPAAWVVAERYYGLQYLRGLEARDAWAVQTEFRGPDWLRHLLGPTVAELTTTVVEINGASSLLNDADLKEIARYFQPRELVLSQTSISDAGLHHLANLKTLEVLILTETNITDEGLRYVSQVQSLRSLMIGHTNITDEGLLHLARLHNLELLNIVDTHISPEAVKRLKAALPKCNINGPGRNTFW